MESGTSEDSAQDAADAAATGKLQTADPDY
jgi:hypothetical protein